MTDNELFETTVRAILIAKGNPRFEDDGTWEDLYDRYVGQSRRGEPLDIPQEFVEALSIAEAVVAAIRPLPVPNPAIVIDWQQQDDRTWTADIAEGWSAEVRQSLGDGTWSFVVNQSGRCYLDSRETAVSLAEENARARIADAISEAASTSRAFGLGLPIEARDGAA